jgi:endonuclease G
MSNMLPQEGDINRFAWAKLESYTRDLVKRGSEAYVIAGGSGSKETIARGRLNVPARFWKIIVVLPKGSDDLRRINRSTRVIAIDMPNDEGLERDPWRKYLTTVDALEEATGYDFLSNLSEDVQTIIEARKDTGKSVQTPARRRRAAAGRRTRGR